MTDNEKKFKESDGIEDELLYDLGGEDKGEDADNDFMDEWDLGGDSSSDDFTFTLPDIGDIDVESTSQASDESQMEVLKMVEEDSLKIYCMIKSYYSYLESKARNLFKGVTEDLANQSRAIRTSSIVKSDLVAVNAAKREFERAYSGVVNHAYIRNITSSIPTQFKEGLSRLSIDLGILHQDQTLNDTQKAAVRDYLDKVVKLCEQNTANNDMKFSKRFSFKVNRLSDPPIVVKQNSVDVIYTVKYITQIFAEDNSTTEPDLIKLECTRGLIINKDLPVDFEEKYPEKKILVFSPEDKEYSMYGFVIANTTIQKEYKKLCDGLKLDVDTAGGRTVVYKPFYFMEGNALIILPEKILYDTFREELVNSVNELANNTGQSSSIVFLKYQADPENLPYLFKNEYTSPTQTYKTYTATELRDLILGRKELVHIGEIFNIDVGSDRSSNLIRRKGTIRENLTQSNLSSIFNNIVKEYNKTNQTSKTLKDIFEIDKYFVVSRVFKGLIPLVVNYNILNKVNNEEIAYICRPDSIVRKVMGDNILPGEFRKFFLKENMGGLDSVTYLDLIRIDLLPSKSGELTKKMGEFMANIEDLKKLDLDQELFYGNKVEIEYEMPTDINITNLGDVIDFYVRRNLNKLSAEQYYEIVIKDIKEFFTEKGFNLSKDRLQFRKGFNSMGDLYKILLKPSDEFKDWAEKGELATRILDINKDYSINELDFITIMGMALKGESGSAYLLGKMVDTMVNPVYISRVKDGRSTKNFLKARDTYTIEPMMPNYQNKLGNFVVNMVELISSSIEPEFKNPYINLFLNELGVIRENITKVLDKAGNDSEKVNIDLDKLIMVSMIGYSPDFTQEDNSMLQEFNDIKLNNHETSCRTDTKLIEYNSIIYKAYLKTGNANYLKEVDRDYVPFSLLTYENTLNKGTAGEYSPQTLIEKYNLDDDRGYFIEGEGADAQIDYVALILLIEQKVSDLKEQLPKEIVEFVESSVTRIPREAVETWIKDTEKSKFQLKYEIIDDKSNNKGDSQDE